MLPASIKSSNVIKAGALFANAPKIFVEADGKTLVGEAPDLAKAVGELLGVTFKWSNMQWPGQLPGLQAGTVDVLWGQVSDTGEREKSIVDLVVWYKGGEDVLIPAKNPHHLTQLSDACGLKIGVPVGSVQQQAVASMSTECQRNGKGPIHSRQYPDAKSAISALRAGGLDGWVDSADAQEYAAKTSNGEFTAIPAKLREGNDAAIAVSKANPGLTKALAGALKKVVQEGTYAKILKKYGVTSGGVTAGQVQINPVTGTPAGAKQ